MSGWMCGFVSGWMSKWIDRKVDAWITNSMKCLCVHFMLSLLLFCSSEPERNFFIFYKLSVYCLGFS